MANTLKVKRKASRGQVQDVVRARWSDWTEADGRSNSSPLFSILATEIERLIRGDAHALIAGRAGGTARMVAAHIAHVFKFVPSAESPRPNDGDQVPRA